MTILHYIPKIDKDSFPCKFIAEITEGEQNGVSSYIMTTDTVSDASEFCGLTVHRILPCSQFCIGGRRRFTEIVDSIHPDVIHIHSLWGFSTWLIFKWAMEKRLPIVLSPYKSLMEWNYRQHYFLSKLPQLAFVQHYMLKHASAIHAVTKQEFVTLKTISWYPGLRARKPWNDKLSLIIPARNVDENGNTDVQRVASEFSRLYRKVIDSNPFLVMSDTDRDLENLLLAYGTSLQFNVSSDRIYLDIDRMKDKFVGLSEESWRRIRLHCSDQGILQPVTVAADALISGREERVDVTSLDRFVSQADIPFLETVQPRIKVARMHQLRNDYHSYEKECMLCVMLLNARHLLSEGKLSRRNLADLYAAFRFSEYNDYMLENMLDEIGMRKFTSRIFYILHSSLCLEEGYMPFGMLCDRRTKNIIKKLFKSNIQ